MTGRYHGVVGSGRTLTLSQRVFSSGKLGVTFLSSQRPVVLGSALSRHFRLQKNKTVTAKNGKLEASKPSSARQQVASRRQLPLLSHSPWLSEEYFNIWINSSRPPSGCWTTQGHRLGSPSRHDNIHSLTFKLKKILLVSVGPAFSSISVQFTCVYTACFRLAKENSKNKINKACRV